MGDYVQKNERYMKFKNYKASKNNIFLRDRFLGLKKKDRVVKLMPFFFYGYLSIQGFVGKRD